MSLLKSPLLFLRRRERTSRSSGCLVFSFALVAAGILSAHPLRGATSPDALFAIGPRTERQALLVDELRSADAKICISWLEKIDAAPACPARAEDRLVALEFWAQHDPEAALNYADAHDAPAQTWVALREAAIRGWTRRDPKAAWDWSLRQPVQSDSDWPRVVLETTAETAPDLGIGYVLEEARHNPDPNGVDQTLSERVLGFFRKLIDIGDFNACQQLVERYPRGEFRNQVLFFVADRMSGFALEETAAWAKKRQGDDRLYPMAAAALQWARRDADAALVWALDNSDTPLRAKLIRAVAAESVSHDASLAKAEHILSQLKAPTDREGAYGAFAGSEELVHLDPVKMTNWAAEISDPDDRRRCLIHAYAIWSDFDSAKARAHLRAPETKLTDGDRAAVQNYLAPSSPQP
jgi:hypothetical protein